MPVVHLPPKQLASQSDSILNTCTMSHAPWAMIGIPTTFPVGAVEADVAGVRAAAANADAGKAATVLLLLTPWSNQNGRTKGIRLSNACINLGEVSVVICSRDYLQ